MFVVVGDEDQGVVFCFDCFVDCVLDQWLVNDWQYFFGYGFGCWQELGVQICYWEYCFVNVFVVYQCLLVFCVGNGSIVVEVMLLFCGNGVNLGMVVNRMLLIVLVLQVVMVLCSLGMLFSICLCVKLCILVFRILGCVVGWQFLFEQNSVLCSFLFGCSLVQMMVMFLYGCLLVRWIICLVSMWIGIGLFMFKVQIVLCDVEVVVCRINWQVLGMVMKQCVIFGLVMVIGLFLRICLWNIGIILLVEVSMLLKCMVMKWVWLVF